MNGWILWKEREATVGKHKCKGCECRSICTNKCFECEWNDVCDRYKRKGENIVRQNKCSKCAHRDFCNAGTKDCNSFVPRSEVAEASDQRAFYERMRREYREAWNDYAMND